ESWRIGEREVVDEAAEIIGHPCPRVLRPVDHFLKLESGVRSRPSDAADAKACRERDRSMNRFGQTVLERREIDRASPAITVAGGPEDQAGPAFEKRRGSMSERRADLLGVVQFEKQLVVIVVAQSELIAHHSG